MPGVRAGDLAAVASVGVEDMLRVPVEVELQKALVEVERQKVPGVVRLPVDLTEVQLPENPRGGLLPDHPIGLFVLKTVVQRMTGITFLAPDGTKESPRLQPVLRWASRILYLLVRPLLRCGDRLIT
jgi:hypothetical protein